MALAFASIGVLLFGFVAACIVGRGFAGIDPGWDVSPVHSAYVVVACDSFSRNAGLRMGDRLVSVAGDSSAGTYGPDIPLARISPNSSYPLTVRRDGREVTVWLKIGSNHTTAASAYVTATLVGLLLYVVGAWVGTARWGDFTARLAAIAFILSALAMLRSPLSLFPGWTPLTATLATVTCFIWKPWHLPVAYHFLSRFPQRLNEGLTNRLTRWSLYFVAGVLWLAMNSVLLAQMIRQPITPFLSLLLQLRPDHYPGSLANAGFESVAGGIMCLVIWRNYRHNPDPGSQRKIRWVSLGFCFALLIFFILAIARFALYSTGVTLLAPWYQPVETFGYVMVGVAPVALGYAVLKHRVLGIRVVIRQGLRYLLAKRALQFITLLPLILIATQVVRDRRQPLTEILHESWHFDLFLLLTGSVSLRYRGQMQDWLDRRFFRPAYDQERILAELIDLIKNVESEQALWMLVAREVELAFQVDGLHILLRNRQTHGLAVIYSRFTDRAAKLRDFINQHQTEDAPGSSIMTVYQCDENARSGVYESTDCREHLVVPLSAMGASSMGVLIVGPKRSDEPYTARDRDLLKTLGSQLGMMCEVLRLKKIVQDEGRARVEVLGHLARQQIELLTECPDCGNCYTTSQETCERDGAALTLTLPVERIIDKKYRLERRIGRGGMGVVYQASDLRLTRTVAIKIMIGDLFGRPSAVARFQREARAAALLDHTNIIGIYDFGEISAGGAYIAMEFISGQSLRDYFRSSAALPPQLVADLTSQLCSAVSVAHRKGVVHRDLKPENLMIEKRTRDTRLVVLDFGLAQVRSELNERGKELTVAGAILGTWDYMSPEQRAGLPVDSRTDIYSIAVICTEMLSGLRPPKIGGSLDWLRLAIGRVAKDGVHLTAALGKALADNASDRHKSVADFEGEFLGALSQTEFEQSFAIQRVNAQDDTITHLPNGY